MLTSTNGPTFEMG